MHKAILFVCFFAALANVFAIDCPLEEEFPTFLPNESDCSLYYECSNGIPILMECPEGMAFNPVFDVCDIPANVPGCS
ncbi:hypothetical protein Trydic_g17219 [Trypoxylus dichotomus]